MGLAITHVGGYTITDQFLDSSPYLVNPAPEGNFPSYIHVGAKCQLGDAAASPPKTGLKSTAFTVKAGEKLYSAPIFAFLESVPGSYRMWCGVPAKVTSGPFEVTVTAGGQTDTQSGSLH